MLKDNKVTLVPPMTTAEIDLSISYLITPGPASIAGFGLGLLAGIAIGRQVKNRSIGCLLGSLTTLTSTAIGLERNFDANLRKSVESGEFDQNFPRGYWKELMRYAATGQKPAQSVILTSFD